MVFHPTRFTLPPGEARYRLRMIEEYRGAPTWDEISRVGQFVHARAQEQMENAAKHIDGGDDQRDRIDGLIALQRTVAQLCAGPTARFRLPTEPAHEAEDDSAKRRLNFSALVAMADNYRSHPDWDPDWRQQ